METFSFVYLLSLLASLLTAYLLELSGRTIPVLFKFFIIPMIIGYLTIWTSNIIFPGLNRSGRNLMNYTDNVALGTINNLNYTEIFPPLLIAILLFIGVIYA